MKGVKHIRRGGLVCWLCGGMLLWTLPAWSQTEDYYMDAGQILEIESRMLYFYDQLQELAAQIPQYSSDQLPTADQQVLIIDTKWNTYYQSRQTEIAEDDSLLQIVANYQLAKQNLLDSIASKKHFYEAEENFTEAETFFSAQDSVYQQLYKTAFEYSLLKTLAPQLEQLKGREQMLFEEMQQQYETAKGLAQEFASFQPRFQPLEEKYLVLKNTSEKIQALEYKSWLQRVKDYLYSLAAVALILMFINMVQAKIKVLKQARENAKKLRDMMNPDQTDYPTI